jgi:hypothetical protein
VRKWRIPGIIDLVIADERAAIRDLGENRNLDRRLDANGPLINRMIASRVRCALTVDGKRLPSIGPREDRARAQNQAELKSRLHDLCSGPVVDEETLRALADAVRGVAGAPVLAIPAQQAIGRWFVQDYVADDWTWRAASTLNAAVTSMNLIWVLYLYVSGAVRSAKRELAARVKGNLAGVHATAIAVHNVVRGLEVMRELWRDQHLRRRLSDDAAVGRCLFAPANVLRQATTAGDSVSGALKPGTLVVLALEAARQRAPGDDVTFLSRSWSYCPASEAVLALLRAVWSRALADETESKRP